jgi:2-keto-4-pentenoate hydratase/2-oxohepta-3-ene-1,7-dioic acid hydratase in catechol pathway
MWLKLNGQVMQETSLNEMLFKLDALIAHVSQYMKLEEGDLLLTGTPAGVGPFRVGDTLQAGIGHDFLKMQFKVLEKPAINMKNY